MNQEIKESAQDSKNWVKVMKSKKFSFLLIGLNIVLLSCFALTTSLTATQAASLIDRIKGRILLQVQQHGEAWYVNPVDSKRYYLGRPSDCFEVMRSLGLGITDNDLGQIVIGDVGAPKITQIKVYFASNKNTTDCSGTVKFLRNVPYTQAVGTAAVNEMLKGPSMKEGEVGINAIPSGTKLLSLKIEGGIAYATFSKELQNYGGGSCAVSAIRAQIENTLKQFSTVNSVTISVEGVPQEEVLQP